MYKISLLIHVKESNSGFSFFAMQAATEFNIDGIVRFMGDGIYLVEAEGKENQINDFVEWCNNSPKGGVVTEYKLKSNRNKIFSTFGIL